MLIIDNKGYYGGISFLDTLSGVTLSDIDSYDRKASIIQFDRQSDILKRP